MLNGAEKDRSERAELNGERCACSFEDRSDVLPCAISVDFSSSHVRAPAAGMSNVCCEPASSALSTGIVEISLFTCTAFELVARST